MNEAERPECEPRHTHIFAQNLANDLLSTLTLLSNPNHHLTRIVRPCVVPAAANGRTLCATYSPPMLLSLRKRTRM